MKFRLKPFVISIILFFLFIPAVDAFSPPDKKIEEQILYYTNRFRASKGLKKLQMIENVNAVARQHSYNMARRKTAFGHAGFNNRFSLLRRTVPGTFTMAENVAYGARSAKEVVDMWKKSTQHRKNMMGDYRNIGIGVAVNKSGVAYFTQIFLR